MRGGHTPSRRVALVGVGSTAFGRWPERGLDDLGLEAALAALADGSQAPADLDAVFVGNAIGGLITGQEQIRGQMILRELGVDHVPVVNTENACASSSTALHLGWTYVASGMADAVLVLGVEKMSHPDKSVTVAAVGTATDPRTIREVLGTEEVEPGRSVFMDLYAERVKKYMAATGATSTDFAEVVVKSRANGSLNPIAQFRQPVSADEVLSAREVSDPLTVPMCSPVTDGASAVLLVSEDLVRDGHDPVWFAASALTSGLTPPGEPVDAHGASRRAADLAYEMAGIGPNDLDLVELHDATAPGELMHMENLSLCPKGEAAEMLRSGITQRSGRLPVNPSGGLLSRGHPLGATGVAQIIEIADQLRRRAGERRIGNDAPRVGLAHNGGGNVGGQSAAVAVHVLHR